MRLGGGEEGSYSNKHFQHLSAIVSDDILQMIGGRRGLFNCRSKLLKQLKRTTSELKAGKIKVSIDRVNQRLKCSLDQERLDEEEKALSLIKENPRG